MTSSDNVGYVANKHLGSILEVMYCFEKKISVICYLPDVALLVSLTSCAQLTSNASYCMLLASFMA